MYNCIIIYLYHSDINQHVSKHVDEGPIRIGMTIFWSIYFIYSNDLPNAIFYIMYVKETITKYNKNNIKFMTGPLTNI